MSIKKTGLELLREPFESHQISYLPKGGVKLAYVGHAALTDRLLDCDPMWNWEPMSVDSFGQPVLKDGGMWIKLTVCGVTRIGFGDAGDKKGPNAIKEIIGDALRNAAMRFGAALDLWHKGELHIDEVDYAERLRSATTMLMLQSLWNSIPKTIQPSFSYIKDEMKTKLIEVA